MHLNRSSRVSLKKKRGKNVPGKKLKKLTSHDMVDKESRSRSWDRLRNWAEAVVECRSQFILNVQPEVD